MKRLENKIITTLASVKGDAMLLLVVIFLFLFSINTVLSSSSLLSGTATGRMSTLVTQSVIILIGFVAIAVIYKKCTFKGLIKFGIGGFLISLALLIFLSAHIRIPHVLESQYINHGWRTVLLFGRIQIHVFEIVKIFSVMYMAWATITLKEDEKVYLENENDDDILNDKRGFSFMRKLAYHFRKPWIDSPMTKRILFVYLPFVAVAGLVARGSNSSAIIIALGMLVTLYIGDFGLKRIAKFILVGVAALALILGAMLLVGSNDNNSRAGGGRTDTFRNRMEAFFTPYERGLGKIRDELKRGKSTMSDYYQFIDDNRQVQGAKIAIHEGRVSPLGKLPGGSTQKYEVTNIYGDFMFSFICEEYGIIGAIFVIFLYGCLIARGIKIAGFCSSDYARTIVAGLVILISGQALLHILVNVGVIPMTGQTLPILSDGKSAFIMFSVALGVVLGVSRLVHEEIMEGEIPPTIQHDRNDDIQNTLDELDAMDTNGL